jgi:hypothetical protein
MVHTVPAAASGQRGGTGLRRATGLNARSNFADRRCVRLVLLCTMWGFLPFIYFGRPLVLPALPFPFPVLLFSVVFSGCVCCGMLDAAACAPRMHPRSERTETETPRPSSLLLAAQSAERRLRLRLGLRLPAAFVRAETTLLPPASATHRLVDTAMLQQHQPASAAHSHIS